MQFTPRRAPVEENSELDRIGKQAALLQIRLASVAKRLRERETEGSSDVADDIESLAQALAGFRRNLDEHREEQDGVMSREAKLALFEVSRAITSSLDLQTVLNQVMDAVIDLTKAERGYLVLLDERGGHSVQVARNIDQDTIRSMEFAFSSSVVEEVLRSDRSVLTNNAQTDERFSLNTSVTMFRLTSIMAAPLRIRGKVIGVLYVDNRVFAGQFSQQKLEMLEAFAGQAAIAIHNAKLFGQTDEALKARLAELERLYRELAQSRERAEQGLAAANREMQLGRFIQSEFLPRELPSMPGWQLAARFLPARHLSGDFYDVYRLPAGDIAIAIADVCDKGVGAALFMSLVRGLLRSNASRARGRHEVLSTIAQTNDFLADNHGRTAMFTTLFFGVLDPDSGELVYVNCGHDAPIVIGAGGEEARLDSSGPALGAMRDVELETGRIVLLPGDTLVAFTDGITDALDPQETQFGEERFLSIVRAGSPSVTAMLGDVEAAVMRHIRDAPQFDDITLLALRRNGERRGTTQTAVLPATLATIPPPPGDTSFRRPKR
jgi:sigma-B regulation protein RsbU (phosphoserine phosphatase)